MEKYLIPLLLHVGACGVQENDIPEKPIAVASAEPRPDRSSGITLGTLDTPKLQPVFHSFGDDTGAPDVRPLNALEIRTAKETIALTRQLAPYAAQLTDNSVMAEKRRAFTQVESTTLYQQFIDKAEEALAAGHIFIEPGLVAIGAHGRYHLKWIKKGEQTVSRYVVYTFREDLSTWRPGFFMHEIAHDTFPTKHAVGFKPTTTEILGRHVVTNEDHVYDVGETFELAAAPIGSMLDSMEEARVRKSDPRETLNYVLAIQGMSDHDWSEKMLEAIYQAFQGYLDQVGISRSELAAVLHNQAYRKICKEQIGRAIKEFAAEVKLDTGELAELQSHYGITPASDEVHIVITLEFRQRYDDTPEGRLQSVRQEEEITRRQEADDEKRERINAAVRRTRDWK